MFLQIVWESLFAGEDGKDKFVSYQGVKIYDNLTSYSKSGSLHKSASGINYSTLNVSFNDVKIQCNKFTLVYLLFYNLGSFNPLIDPKEVNPRDNTKPCTMDNVVISDILKIDKSLKLLLLTLHDQNLLLRGNYSCYSLLPDRLLGLDVDFDRVSKA